MTTPIQDAARWLHGFGANVTAIEAGAKWPAHTWDTWQTQRQRLIDVDTLPWQGYIARKATKRRKVGDAVRIGGVGIINGIGGWRTFDLDAHKDPETKEPIAPISDATVDALLSALGLPLSYPWVWRSGSSAGWELAIRCDETMPVGVLTDSDREKGVFIGWPEKDSAADWNHIELRWENNQTVAPPSASPAGGYRWRSATPDGPPALLTVRRVIEAFFTLAPPPAWNLGTVDRAIVDRIKAQFDLVSYAQRELGGEIERDGHETRVLGHQGLLIEPEKGLWFIHGETIGGDALDLVAYCKYKTTARNLNGKSAEILALAAQHAGVTLPDRSSSTTIKSPAVESSTPEDTELPLLLPAHDLDRIPPAEPLVTNLIYTKKIHQLFGPAGSGKSFLALDIGATIAQHYPVIYVAAEAIEDYPERIDAWEAHYGQSAGQLFFWRQPLTLASEQDVQHFIATARPIGPAIIFLDPLADCMTGLNENDPRDMSIAVYALNTIRRQLGAAIVVIHHTGWSTEHERGHSTLRAACRVVAKVEAREDGLIRLTCEKKNHGRKFDPRSFRLVGAGTKGGVLPLPARLVIPGKLRLEEKLLRIMEALTTEPLRKGATHTALLQDTSVPAATLNRSLTSLCEAGYVRGEDNGRSRLYYLTEAGRDALDIAFEERSESWSGRTLEEHGRTWNWEVASSTVSGHNKAVLPNSSTVLPSTPPFPPLGGEGGTERGDKVLPPAEQEPYAATARGFRALEIGDDAPLFEEEEEPVQTPTLAPAQVGFNRDYIAKMLAAQNVQGIETHYRIHRKSDVLGMSRDDVIDLAMTECGDNTP